MGRLIILLGIIIGVILAINWFLRTPPEKLAQGVRRGLLWGGVALLVIMVITGRLPWLFALIAAAIPMLQRAFTVIRLVPHLKRLMGMAGMGTPFQGAAGAGQKSTVETRFLRMSLEHASGAMDGAVLEGSYQGRMLSDLQLEQLMQLLAECRDDPQSVSVLRAYLDRVHGDEWRSRAAGDGSGEETHSFSAGEMNREEAWQVLGLSEGANEETIRETHRRLIQKLHPDRGGSSYLAAKINRAKDLLLGD